jgi:hypothetical protein
LRIEKGRTVPCNGVLSRPFHSLHLHLNLPRSEAAPLEEEEDKEEEEEYLPLTLENPVNLLRRRGTAKALADRPIVQEFRNRREGAEMRLKLILRDDKEDDVFDRRVVERVELDAFVRAAKGGDDFAHAVTGSVRDCDAKADAGAHRFLALAQSREHEVAVFGFHFAASDKQFDEFNDGRPSFIGLHLWDNAIDREKIAKIHSVEWT